jgi:hypothetical protein
LSIKAQPQLKFVFSSLLRRRLIFLLKREILLKAFRFLPLGRRDSFTEDVFVIVCGDAEVNAMTTQLI